MREGHHPKKPRQPPMFLLDGLCGKFSDSTCRNLSTGHCLPHERAAQLLPTSSAPGRAGSRTAVCGPSPPKQDFGMNICLVARKAGLRLAVCSGLYNASVYIVVTLASRLVTAFSDRSGNL